MNMNQNQNRMDGLNGGKECFPPIVVFTNSQIQGNRAFVLQAIIERHNLGMQQKIAKPDWYSTKHSHPNSRQPCSSSLCQI